jgi:hypothetical protein
MFKMDNWPASCIVQEVRKKIEKKKKNSEKNILKKQCWFFKKPIPFKSDGFFLKNQHLLKGDGFLKKMTLLKCDGF